MGYKRNGGKCHDTDQGIRCVDTVTVSYQRLQYRCLGALRNSGNNKMTSNIYEASHLLSNHEDLDSRAVLDAAAVGYTRNVRKCFNADQGIRCVNTVTVSYQMLGCSQEQRE